jgi:CheY-like chemotaxis protein
MSELLARTLGEPIRIETVLAGGLWRCHADASQLENAVVNLAVNARDAMPDGGRLTIETANCHLDERYSASHNGVPAGQYVLIAVSDTGEGMSAEVQDRAFDPFFTTKPVGKGTGLGLSQVFGFVRQSGGHVKIYSEVGQGTTVKIYLPRWFGEETGPEAATPATNVRGSSGEIVLVVEDDERVRALSVEALRELGYTVLHARDGEEALRRVETTEGLALLFTDIVMPGMDGRKLADEALRRRPGLKVLFTTGFTRNAVVHNGVLDHGVDFLAKPFTVDQLAAKVRQVLDAVG